MRTLLTSLAIVIILALTTALVGPMLVDWKRQKPLVEAQLARLLGVPVHIRGDVSVQLLPSPRLDLTELHVGRDGDDAAKFEARAAHLELAVTALLHGEYQFSEVNLEAPQLVVVRSASGGLEFPLKAPEGKLPAVRLERFAAHAGRVIVLDARSGARLALEDVTLDAEASSLLGPLRGSGSVRGPEGPVHFRYSTGAVAGQRLQVKVVVTAGAGVPHIDVDGSLVLPPRAAADGTATSFVGNVAAVMDGNIATSVPPWSLNGALTADPGHAVVNKLDLQVGENSRAIRAGGTAEIAFGERPSAHLSLTTKQIDFDRQLGTDAGVLRPLDGLERLRKALGSLPLTTGGRFPVTLDVAVAAVTLGGDLVSDLSGTLEGTVGQEFRLKFAARGPAQSRLSLDGRLEPGAAVNYKGRLDFATQDRRRFVAWAAQGEASVLPALNRVVPFHTVAVAGAAEISRVDFVLRDLTAVLDRSTLAGTIAFTAPVGGERARLFASLTSEALDLDAVPSDGPLPGGVDLDLALDVSAKSVRVAGINDAPVHTGEIDLKLTRTGGSTRLERLHVAQLGGAALDAHGSVDAGGGHFEAGLDADDLHGLTALAEHVLPESIGAALMQRAGALSPAKLDAAIELTPGPVLARLDARGTLGSTQLHGSFSRDAQAADVAVADLQLASDDAGQVLRQFGLAGAKRMKDGRSRLQFKARGRLRDDMEASLTGAIADSEVAWHGHLAAASETLDGPASLKSADIAPLLRSLGVVTEGSTRLTASLEANLRVALGQISLNRLSGSFGGTKLSGQVAMTSGSEASDEVGAARVAQLTANLGIDRLALATVASLVLGPPPAGADPLWSAQRFASVPAQLPETHAALRIDALDLGGDLGVARDAALSVALAPNLLRLELQPAAVGPGTLGGAAALRRIGSNVSLNGRLTATQLLFERAFARGRLSGTLDFAGTGESPKALIAGLAGRGSATLAGIQLPKFDPGAMSRVVKALDAETLPLEAAAVDRALTNETAAGTVQSPKLDLPLLLAAGSLRFGSAAVATPGARIELSGQLDLTQLEVAVNETATALTPPPDWRGPLPAMALVWTGPLKAPRRRVEAAGFFSGLSARALSINLRKLADFESDVRERAFFNHRLKITRETDEHERREALARAAEERRRQDEERRRQDEERRRQDEERRRQQDAERRRLETERATPQDATDPRRAPLVPLPAEKREPEDVLKALPTVPDVSVPNVIPGPDTR